MTCLNGVVAGFADDPPSSDADEEPTLLTAIADAHPTAHPLRPEVLMPAWHPV